MIETLRQYLEEKKIPLSTEQMGYWLSQFSARIMQRGEFLLREGETSKFLAFVARGCLRLYSTDEKGKEHIIQFAPENWWISDMEGMISSKPSAYFIDALEQSGVLLISNEKQTQLFEKIPSAVLFFQNMLMRRQAAIQKRMLAGMSATAEQRYLDFVNTYQSLAQRVPQHMIASYLGITPESLSRVRKRLAKKKK